MQCTAVVVNGHTYLAWSTYLVKESPLIPYPLKVHFILISTYVKNTHFSFDGSKTVGKGQEPRWDRELGPNPLQVQKKAQKSSLVGSS